MLLSFCVGTSGLRPLGISLQGVLATLGLAEPVAGKHTQSIIELGLLRTLTAMGVGAALSLSGALLQGVFRNDLASPSILGISSGATFGATLAIVLLGGYGPLWMLVDVVGFATLFVTFAAFLGAIAVTLLVALIGTRNGRISVPTLLLVGIAMNAVMGGLIAVVQSIVLDDFEIAKAVFAWGFGTITDRSQTHVTLVLVTTALAATVIPFVAVELDLFAAGEEDASALGVHIGRVKALALCAAALSASVAVSVAGQIAFVGLIVPHILRLTVRREHRSLLPLAIIGGALFLLSCDVVQRLLPDAWEMRTGVLVSLLSGPFFLFLLVRHKDRIQAW